MAEGTATAPAAAPASVVDPSQLGGRGARLLAQIIDGFIAGILISLSWGPAIAGTVLVAMAEEDDAAAGGAGLGAIGLVFGLLLLAYAVAQIYLLTTQGQTIGKKVMGLRVVLNSTGRNGGFVPNVLLRLFVNGLLSAIPFYSLVDIFLIFRDDRRCIHDMLSNTSVVKA